MERIVHISKPFEEADEYDLQQILDMPLAKRLEAADELNRAVYPQPWKDILECRHIEFRRRESSKDRTPPPAPERPSQ
ncbi:MAG TPA: hypothetical protein PKG77_24450 [Phycisphaerae bacterium]|mgnify:CR=1 FL=1|nr:hypothetical protein [Phycisphaerae bacterium]HQL76488.1 hypothetical protein [Phycisphaerae bacterium]